MYHSGHYYTENQRTGVILQAKLTVRYFDCFCFIPRHYFCKKILSYMIIGPVLRRGSKSKTLWLSTFYTKYSKNSEGLFWGKRNSFGFSLKMCSDHNHVHSLRGASFCSCEWTIEVPCLLSFFSHLIFLEKSHDKLIVWCLDCLKLQPKSAFF